MKRIAFVAAAALLGTGCISSTTTNNPPPPTPTGDVALYWQFRDYDLNLSGASGDGAGCGVAGVTDVDVAIYAGSTRVVWQTVPCQQSNVAGVAYTLPVGTYTYTLDGYRGPDWVFASATGTIEAMDGMPMADDATLDVASTTLPLTVYYKMNGAYTCTGIDNIYYQIWDVTGTTLVAEDQVPCDDVAHGLTLPYDEPVGTYYVEWFQARNAVPLALYERCPFNLRHAGFPAIVNLLPTPVTCP